MPPQDANRGYAYGSNARKCLEPLQPELHDLAREATRKFYSALRKSPAAAKILGRLQPEEFERLVGRQEGHFAMVLSGNLVEKEHVQMAQNAGRIHVFVGADPLLLIQAYGTYHEEICKTVRKRIQDPVEMASLMRIVYKRILIDIEAQLQSYNSVNKAISEAFRKIDKHTQSTSNMTDLIRGALKIICLLPGPVSAVFGRADEQGRVQIEQSHGEAGEQYHQALKAGVIPGFSINPEHVLGQGPGGAAWGSGRIVTSDAWLQEASKAPWQNIGNELGFRSSAAIPLLDKHGRSIAILGLYSPWPGYFSTVEVNGFISHVQHVLSMAIQQITSSAVIPLHDQKSYRAMLAQKKVTMQYQPIIDLETGALVKLEALARMPQDDGSVIAPDRFLPAFGKNELLGLFQCGLEQACGDSFTLKSQGMEPRIAINFSAEGLDDPRYEEVFFKTLEAYKLPASVFQLEVLETQDVGEKSNEGKAFIERLRKAGVQIAQDDLGSGHSSLRRMDQYPFDEVKIDQGLVRTALRDPQHAVQFILYLTRLSHAFNTPVTVEGLENRGMIEAAAILGADRGQGYGIGKPMPVEQVRQWRESFRFDIDPSRPRTAIGAMAAYLLWDFQIAAVAERPEVAAEFVSAKAIVEHFIDFNELGGSTLDTLLQRNYELATSQQGATEKFRVARENLLAELSHHWLTEAGDTPP